MSSTKRPPRPTKKITDREEIRRLKDASSPESSKSKRSRSGFRKTRQTGVITSRNNYLKFIEKKPLPESAVPEGMTKESVHQSILQVIAEKEGKQGMHTQKSAIGRFWEVTYQKFKGNRENISAALDTAIDMLKDFRKNHYENMGFLDGNGKLQKLSDTELKLLDQAIEALRSSDLSNFEGLKKIGLIYLDSFWIGGKQYKDGAFVLKVGGRFIVLVNIEAKTLYSDGVIEQSGTFAVRLASSHPDEEITCSLNGEKKQLLHQDFLFNPMWLQSQVGIKEAKIDGVEFFNVRNTEELKRRLRGAKSSLSKIPPKERTEFGDDLKKLVVPSFVIYSKTNLRGINDYIGTFLESERRK